MTAPVLTPEELRRSLLIRDLTDPRQGPHALQHLVEDAGIALRNVWRCPVEEVRAPPVVSIEDNYDRLRYPPDAPARDPHHTRYVSATHILRTHTTAMIPERLRGIREASLPDVLLLCPGITYRRDRIDRQHVGEPHQLDLWRIRAGRQLTTESLDTMIRVVVETLLPGRRYRSNRTAHPYTVESLEIEVRDGEGWVEVGECGLAHPEILADAGLHPEHWSGLAMGLGLDRVLMLRKGIGDIRLLRSRDRRVTEQMTHLGPYRPVSNQPAIVRDLSIAVDAHAEAEQLGDRVRRALGSRASDVESVEIVSETPHRALPPAACERMGLCPHQKNLLVRVVLRSLERTLTHDEANDLRDRIYAELHEGSRAEWASRAS